MDLKYFLSIPSMTIYLYQIEKQYSLMCSYMYTFYVCFRLDAVLGFFLNLGKLSVIKVLQNMILNKNYIPWFIMKNYGVTLNVGSCIQFTMSHDYLCVVCLFDPLKKCFLFSIDGIHRGGGFHNRIITMTSQRARWRLKSLASRWFAEPFISPQYY